ncbi:TPA: helix-turn-helix transcriptional regulator [Citrobacter koseri]
MDKMKHITILQEWIEDKLDTPISIAQICEKSGYSERYLQMIFHEKTGFTLHQYVTFRRVYKCAWALKFTYMPINKIAQRYCFNSMPAFSRAFNRIFGVSPRQFRDEDVIDFSALAASQRIVGDNDLILDVKYVHFDGVPLSGLSCEYTVDPHEFDKPHIYHKASLETDFAKETGGQFNEVFCLVQYQKSKMHRDRISTLFSVGVKSALVKNFNKLVPLPPLYGDYLMFTIRDIKVPFFNVAAKAYWEIMYKRRIARRPGADIEKIVWRNASTSMSTIAESIDYSYMIPIVFDNNVHNMLIHECSEL